MPGMRGFLSRRTKKKKEKEGGGQSTATKSSAVSTTTVTDSAKVRFAAPPILETATPQQVVAAVEHSSTHDGEEEEVLAPLPQDIQFNAAASPSYNDAVVTNSSNNNKMRFRPITKAASFRMLRNTARSESYRQIQDWMSSSKTHLYSDDVSPNDLVKEAIGVLQPYRVEPLNAADRVFVSQESFDSIYNAASLQWRLLVAQSRRPNDSTSRYFAYRMVESNQDLLKTLLCDRNIPELMAGLLECIMNDNNKVEETFQSADEMLHLECQTPKDYLYLFARCGVPPSAWVHFVAAVAWAWDTLGGDEVSKDLDRGHDSAILRVLVQSVAVPAMEMWQELSECFGDPAQALLPSFWKRFQVSDRAVLGESIFRNLFEGHPELFDYFSRTDMDHLAFHLILALDVMVKSAGQITNEKGPFRSLVNHLGKIHLAMGVPSYAYPLLGKSIIECLEPYFEEEEKRPQSKAKAAELKAFFVRLYSEVMSLVYYPMVHQEKVLAEARSFFLEVQTLLSWTDLQLNNRMLQVTQDIQATGTYTHTFEELEVGARLAWRNNSSFIHRSAWDTLCVRDCRHAARPAEVFAEIEKHIEVATQDQDLRPVISIFRPLRPNESVGPHFWNDQFVLYAGYRDTATGNVQGDPLNVSLTEYLEANGLWEAPETTSPFDVLPLVYKIPGKTKPEVHVLSDDNIYEVDLEHPSNEAFAALGLRWTAMPSFSTQTLRIGGILYHNSPFNGVYVSTEIAQMLMERFNVGPDIAEVFGFDTKKDPFWRQAAMLELERAIVHSFRSNGVRVFDPHSAGEMFCTHVRALRDQGVDTPIDFKSVGGLASRHSEAWELRDRSIAKKPCFQLPMNSFLFYNSLDHKRDFSSSFSSFEASLSSLHGDDPTSPVASLVPIDIPRVVIAYGTQCGAAEATARKLKRWLRLLNPIVMSLDEAKGLQEVRLKNATHLLCICSTFAHGDPPSNARKFFNTVIPKTSGISFSVLALGSTLFPEYCKAGMALDRMLEEAGLRRLTKAATKADEANSGDATIVQWLEIIKRMLLPAHVEQELERRISLTSKPSIETKFVWLDNPQDDNPSSPSESKSICIANNELTDSSRGRSVRKITFESNGMSYNTGDHLVVQTMNSSKRITRFVSCFKEQLEKHFNTLHKGATTEDIAGFMLEKPFDLVTTENGSTIPSQYIFGTPTTLQKILTEDLDLTLKGSFATDFIGVCVDACTKFKASPKIAEFQAQMRLYLDGKQPLDDLIANYPTIPHFFEAFPFLTSNALVSLADVLTVLPRQQPRYYSITSTPLVDADKMSITVGVLDAKTSKGAKFDGACSHYLAGLRESVDAVSIQVRPSNFRLPEVKSCPLIFVAAGTGISPFIGFLQELQLARNAGQKLGSIHLFYGCRNENDFLYDHVLRRYETDGLITKIHVAMSNSTKRPEQYVQDVIKASGKEFGQLLQKNDAQYYVCGDAVMAQACYEAAIECLRAAGDGNVAISRVAAVQQLQGMNLAQRWHADVWGITSNFEEAKKAVEHSKQSAAKVWLTKFKR